MRMRGKKPIFGYKDTFSLSDTLRPIIGEGIRKFIEVSKGPKGGMFGVPSSFVDGDELTDENIKDWETVLEKMLYAFTEPEPDIMKYDFTFDHIETEGENGRKLYRLEVNNQTEYDRFERDMEEWDRKCKEGYELFGKYFTDLWW